MAKSYRFFVLKSRAFGRNVEDMKSRDKTLLAIFQQSHYEPALFRAWLRRHQAPEDWDGFSDHASPTWSLKARLIFSLARIISFGRPGALPRSLVVAHTLIAPAEAFAARWITWRARRKCARIKFKAVIGITGSYGKTTTKEFVAHILAGAYRVQKTPENINTFFGIARWIKTKNDMRDGDILIVEMGAYHEGDIAAICRMVRPTMAIITGLNEAHRERFGSLDATARTKTELIDALPPGSTAFWNQSSPLLYEYMDQYRGQWPGEILVPYGGEIRKETDESGDALDSFTFFSGDAMSAGRAVSERLGVSPDVFEKRARAFSSPPRRFAVSRAPGNRLIIDDSYNITLDGARAACRALAQIPRRKIGIFAGIPEAGRETKRINRELGRMIGGLFDVILLRATPMERDVHAGLVETGFSEERLIAYTESKEVEPLLRDIARDGDCIYFSVYDLPAIYL